MSSSAKDDLDKYTIVIFRQVKQLDIGTFNLFMLQRNADADADAHLCLPILPKSQIRTTLLLEENIKFPSKSLHFYKKLEKEKIVLFEYKPITEECFLESFTAYSENDRYQWLLLWEILNTKSYGSFIVSDPIVDLFLFIFTSTIFVFEEQEQRQRQVRVGYLHDIPEDELGLLTLYGVNRELFEESVDEVITGYHFFLEYKRPDKGMKCVRYAIVDLLDTFIVSANNDKICLLHYGYHLPLSIL